MHDRRDGRGNGDGCYHAAMFGQLFIQTLSTNPTYFFSVIITVVISITLHELAHGFVAIKLGDDTPIRTGHMTLNPIVHMGMQSLILLALMGIAFGAMPVDRTRLRGRYGEALVAAAGPAMNLILGVLALVSLGVWARVGIDDGDRVSQNGVALLYTFGSTNFALLMFNLIPVPPLDGSWIAANVVPAYRRMMSGDFVRGASSALFFALFLGAGYVIFPAADSISGSILRFIVQLNRAAS